MRRAISIAVLLAVLVSFLLVSSPAESQGRDPKKTIAVLDFDNKSDALGYVGLGDAFSDQIGEALSKTSRFIVLNKEDLKFVVAEQEDVKGPDRYFSKSIVAVKDKMIPAQVFIRGVITEFESRTKYRDSDMEMIDSEWGNYAVNNEREAGYVTLLLAIVDSTTGEVLYSKKIKGEAEGIVKIFDYTYKEEANLDNRNFKKTPIGRATQIVIDNSVEYIKDRLSRISWEGKITKVEDSTCYINAGEKTGIKKGDVFIVYRGVYTVADSDKDVSMDVAKIKVGTVQVYEVEEDFSKAKISGLTRKVKEGDVVSVQ